MIPEQREHLAALLHNLSTAATLAPRAQEIYTDNDAAALGYLAGAWEPVATAYAELAGTGRTGGARSTASLAWTWHGVDHIRALAAAACDGPAQRRETRGVACTDLFIKVPASGSLPEASVRRSLPTTQRGCAPTRVRG
ncbi:MAG: hypothetical protein JO281_10585 [Pseudonocardiales bacterium]|nr:hypothetical protein [Pseudonocardiales bacterium]